VAFSDPKASRFFAFDRVGAENDLFHQLHGGLRGSSIDRMPSSDSRVHLALQTIDILYDELGTR
jgi:hypothetical protein